MNLLCFTIHEYLFLFEKYRFTDVQVHLRQLNVEYVRKANISVIPTNISRFLCPCNLSSVLYLQ